MTDRISKEQRSKNMGAIKGKDTSLEIQVRKHLFSCGFRYRKNDKRYPGKPDILLPKYKTAIFVNGCFWHHHANCKLATYPKSNNIFWKQKLDRNVEKDKENTGLIEKMGFKTITIWECELEADFLGTMLKVIEEIKNSATVKETGERA